MEKQVFIQCSLFSHFDTKIYTPQEVLDLAMSCKEKGASIIHVHIDKFENYTAFIDFAKMLEKKDFLMLTLGAKDVLNIEESDLKEIQSFGCASVQGGNANIFGQDIMQSYEKLCKELVWLTSNDIIPEVCVFNFKSIDNCEKLLNQYACKFYVGIYMGYPGGMEATIANVDTVMNRLKDIPLVFFTIYNNQDDEIVKHILRAGGHIRSGLEDTIYCGSNVATSTEEIVSHIRKLVIEEGQTIHYLNKKQLEKYMIGGDFVV